MSKDSKIPRRRALTPASVGICRLVGNSWRIVGLGIRMRRTDRRPRSVRGVRDDRGGRDVRGDVHRRPDPRRHLRVRRRLELPRIFSFSSVLPSAPICEN